MTIIFVGIIDFYNNLLYNIIIRKEVINMELYELWQIGCEEIYTEEEYEKEWQE